MMRLPGDRRQTEKTQDAEEVPCSACGSDDAQTLFLSFDKSMAGKRNRFPVVQCRDCGLVYLNPRPAAGVKDAFYDHDYPFYHDDEEAGQSLSHYQPVIDALEELPPGKLLDVGTGNGPLLPTMKAKGWDVRGTELSEVLRDYYRSNFDIEVFCGQLEEAGFNDGEFDAVTILGVIEHVPDPQGFLQEVARITRDGGLIVFWCFNRDIEARLLGRYWLGFDTPRHFYSFSYESLQRMMTVAGLDLKGSLFRPICYASYSCLWFYDRAWNRLHRQEKNRTLRRLHLPGPVERLSRPVAEAMAKRKMSSNMFLFAEKVPVPDAVRDSKEMEIEV